MTIKAPGPALFADNEGNVVVRRDLPVPTPVEGEILIEVLFSGSNPSDLRIAGDIVAGYTTYEDYQPVRWGTHQSYISRPPIGMFKVPGNLPLPDAAALTTVVQTANDALFHQFKLPLPSSGQGLIEGTLIVWGGGTAVGMSAIQLARAVGVTSIITTASASRHGLLKELDATQCFDYHDESVVQQIKQAVHMTGNTRIWGFNTAGTPDSSRLLLDSLAGLEGEIQFAFVGLIGGNRPASEMCLAVRHHKLAFDIPGAPEPYVFPAKPAEAEIIWKATEWIVAHYGKEFRLPGLRVFAERAEEALEQLQTTKSYNARPDIIIMLTDAGTAADGRLADHLDRLGIEEEVCPESQLIRNNTEKFIESDDENDDMGTISYYTGRHIYLARREIVFETDELDIDISQSVFLAHGDNEILQLDKLPSMVNESDLIQKHAIEIIRTTEPMTTERSIRFGYLGDQAIDLSELRERCYEAVQAAFMAADSACESLADPEEDTGLDGQKLNSEEILALEEGAEAKSKPDQASYCCFIALTMAARVLEASTAREMAQKVCRGANLDDLIFNIEIFKPLTQSEPWEADVPDKPGYHHLYALLGCLMATAYVHQSFAIETFYLDRAIANLDIAVLKMPNNPFKEFRHYLQTVQKKVQRLQVFFQRVEMEDDQSINSVLCAVCIQLMPVIGFHETNYPCHNMDFESICRKAVLRCRACTLFRDTTASMYPLFKMSWPEIEEINYCNRSVGRRWFGETDDLLADFLWGLDGALRIEIIARRAYMEEKFYATYELYCLPGVPPPWKIIGTGTHVQHDVASPETWDMIQGWIRDCINDHGNCKVVSEDRPFPTRVVAVGSEDTEPHLFIPRPDDRGRYIALSHCWGDVMPLRTTRTTFAEFCQKVDFSRFPKTFQEAIIVCRRLNIQYLWIDSLCIIQDDERDWAVESPKMCDVYQNAYLTIAAAAAHNSSEGLFHRRPFSLRKSFLTVSKNDGKVEEVEIFSRPWDSQCHWQDSIGDGPWCRDTNPLDTRAWTLQEHVLSRRILRFTAHELVWHCRTAHRCECRPGSHANKGSLRLINLEALESGRESNDDSRILEPFILWLNIIGPFTSRAITRDTDRLPAVSGVAAALAPFIKAEYIAGMWTTELGTKICWHVEEGPTSRHETYYAPTWSWASVIGPVRTSELSGICALPQTKIVDVHHTLATPNPYGSVSSATLTISSVLLNVSVSKLDPRPDEGTPFQIHPHNSSLLETDMNLSMECVAFPDILTTSEEAPELVPGDSLCFLILGCKVYCQGFDIMVGILLSQIPTGEEPISDLKYRKVGTGEIRLKDCDEDEEEFREKAVDGLGWYMAHHLERQGCVASVVVV
ncbi:flavin-containing protein [Fusarium pseudoanthophilum]|uniref:Flavin-containing protein n=1 Tax=Fusarium pseudoanthophilum TaxID=48495 RepID=A0A8H5UWI9_9HYPO|nr:flavin-containing protein [Fusarium pseudoanthophilum]